MLYPTFTVLFLTLHLFSVVRYRKMNKRLAARSGVLLPEEGIPLEAGVTRKPSPLTNGSGTPNLPQLIPRCTDTVPYKILTDPMKMDGRGSNAPGSPPDP